MFVKKDKKTKRPRSFSVENSEQTCREPKDIANKFNEYFVGIGLAGKISNNSEFLFENDLNGDHVDSMFAKPIAE